MQLFEALPRLDEICQNTKVAFVKLAPEVPDFTTKENFNLIVFTKDSTLAIDVSPRNIHVLLSALRNSLFSPEYGITVLTWNLKPLFTYHRYFVEKVPEFTGNFIDLRVICNFAGLFEQKNPENYLEAINTVKQLSDSRWKRVYKSLHFPLITKTLPILETNSLHHKQDLTSKFAYYEIEGQRNGRLRSYGRYQRSYVPHTLSETQKNLLIPKNPNDVFLSADINNCEVAMLQYLSNDSRLKQILASNEDVYYQIYEIITGDQCDPSKRAMCKLIFLPVMYGCGSHTLSTNLGVDESVSKDLIKRINFYFPESTEWISNQAEEARSKGCLTDYFGRVRTFTEDNYYTARNFVVQAPASTVCLEKLISITDACISNNAKTVFTIHDGYGITCDVKNVKTIFHSIKSIIHSESLLCPGLKLDLSVEVGKNLNKMYKLK